MQLRCISSSNIASRPRNATNSELAAHTWMLCPAGVLSGRLLNPVKLTVGSMCGLFRGESTVADVHSAKQYPGH